VTSQPDGGVAASIDATYSIRQPAEHCGNQLPPLVGDGPVTECVLGPGHQGSHANHEGARWIETTPAADDRAALLERVLDDADHHDRAATQAHDEGIPELMYTQSGIAGGLRIAAADIARGRPDLVARLKQRIDQRGPVTPATGYCPHCGRGDVAPTADEYEQARRRAVRIQTLLDEQRDRIRKIHQRSESGNVCVHCSERDYPDYTVAWPCPTITALEPLKEQS